MYWNETVPARACSFEATMRISNRPATRLNSIECTAARPRSSVTATSVRSPLTKVPLGPCSGRWKLTAAPSTGRPVSSVTTTAMPRESRAPAACTAPSPPLTWICRMATCATAGWHIAINSAASATSRKKIAPADFARDQVGQTIAFRGLSSLAQSRRLDRRQKSIVCPTCEFFPGSVRCRLRSKPAPASGLAAPSNPAIRELDTSLTRV